MRPSDRHRSVNFTKDERNLMLALGQKYGHIIKRRNNFSLEKKRLVWNEIYTIFNESSTSGVHRSLESLKKLHLNMKNGKRKNALANASAKNGDDEGELTGSSMDYNEESLSSDFEKNEGEDMGINEDDLEIKEEFTPPPLECLLVEQSEGTVKINETNNTTSYCSDPLNLERRYSERKPMQQITITDLLKPTEETSIEKLTIPPDIDNASEGEIKLITMKLNLQLIKKKLDHENELHALKLKKLKLDEEIQKQTLENLRLEKRVKETQLENLQLDSDISKKCNS